MIHQSLKKNIKKRKKKELEFSNLSFFHSITMNNLNQAHLGKFRYKVWQISHDKVMNLY